MEEVYTDPPLQGARAEGRVDGERASSGIRVDGGRLLASARTSARTRIRRVTVTVTVTVSGTVEPFQLPLTETWYRPNSVGVSPIDG